MGQGECTMCVSECEHWIRPIMFERKLFTIGISKACMIPFEKFVKL